jgi:hypothetical protein
VRLRLSKTPLCRPQATTPKGCPATACGSQRYPFFIKRAIFHRPVGVPEFLEPLYRDILCAAARGVSLGWKPILVEDTSLSLRAWIGEV